MIADCLIKESKYNYSIKYNQVSDVIDISLINKKFNNNFIEKDFSLFYKENNYFAKKTINYNILNLISNNLHIFSDEIMYLKENYSSHSKEDIIIYYLIELICLIELKKNNVINEKEFYKYISELEYVSKDYLESLRQIIFYKNNIKKVSFVKNKDLLITNKNSYEFPRNIENLKNREIKTLIKSLDLPLIEIPNNKDTVNIVLFLRNLLKIKRELKLKKFNFCLRIKKTRKDNQGMFIINSNTIIVDPRYPDCIIHEIGHYIYENNLSFTYNDNRYFASNFKKYINKYKKENNVTIKKNEIETYSDDSEVFALWFEKIYN